MLLSAFSMWITAISSSICSPSVNAASFPSCLLYTSIISITDGQIYLSSDLFFAGQRPAINVGLSVSRIGSSAQHPAIKWIGGRLRLSIAQYRELAVFAQFGAEVDATTTKQIHRGERMMEVLKQGQEETFSVASEAVLLLALAHNVFWDLPLSEIRSVKYALLDFVRSACPGSLRAIEATGELNQEEIATLKKAMDAFLEGRNAG